jgi:hypothetical protein
MYKKKEVVCKRSGKKPADKKVKAPCKNNRKRVLKRGGGDDDITDVEKIAKMRAISVKCCGNKSVQEYIKKMCNNIYRLIVEYTKANKLELLTTLKEYCSTVNNKSSAGQIEITYSNINYIRYEANVREGMTFIMNFAMTGCKIILWALSKNLALINNKQSLIDRFFVLTGQRSIDNIYNIVSECKENCLLPCKFTSLSLDGVVTASRMTIFPFHDKLLRIKRLPTFLNINSNKIEKEAIYPPLSIYEVRYMGKDADGPYLPWVSGYQYWELNKDHYYAKLMIDNNQLFISGPSGNTDLQLSIFKLFSDYDLNLSLLSCVAWMCNTPDHSPCEILLAAIPFGLKDWDITIDAFEYVNILLSKVEIKELAAVSKKK